MRLVLLILACGPFFYYLLCFYSVVGYFRALRKAPKPTGFAMPAASILKPVRGVDREAYENFASYCRLSYPEYELIFAVADLNDPAIPVIEQLQRDYPDRQVRLVTGVERLGKNNKVNNLCRLVKEAKYDLLVMTDSDVRVEEDYLQQVAAAFSDTSVGAVTTFYRCNGGGTLAADLHMLAMCTDSVPSALVARNLEGKIQFAFGWTMATTKKHLAEIGGWEAMADYHSDDFELGNRIARAGHRVELMREPVWVIFSRETMKDFFSHELRWSIGLRNVRPTAYFGMIFTHGLPWALLAAVVARSAGWNSVAAAYLASYLILRIGLVWTTAIWGMGDKVVGTKLWLVPLRDAVNFCVWLAAFFSDKIKWRGLEYRVKKRLLIPIVDGEPEN
ncbi:MAG TPA: bacteriohopanetetrol glucosamine biosynthesis glycosyltransferase HpnI [Candidatus Acidoferrum sp.]|jgi:ceramide glucosyltransferase